MSDAPSPANVNVDTAKVMMLEGAKFALGLINAPASVVSTIAAAGVAPPPQNPRLTIIQGGRAQS